MTFKKRIKIVAVIILIIPLFALIITGTVFFISWTLSWDDSEDLSVPRFLHEPLLNALQGNDVSESRFAGIIFVLDDSGKIVYIAPKVEEMIEGKNWKSMDDAYREIMSKMPGTPINMIVYHYQNHPGLVMYIENFFTGMKLFRTSSLLIFTLYFGMIVVPVLFVSINARSLIRSIITLENAAAEIGKGNLDTPIQTKTAFRKHQTGFKELTSLVEAFEKMRLELKENQENQSRIIMSISHDLKTPLTLIKGYVEALKDGMAESPEEIAEYAEVIFDRSMLLEERINDLVYFTKLKTSDWQTRFEGFVVNELLEESADIFKNDSHIRKRNFQYTCGITDGIEINGDKKLLYQVFENLFENACRHTKEDDVISLSAVQDKNLIYIKIEDSGQGVSIEHQPYIFDMFYRADSGRNTKGLGIGLSSAKTIIENHGGRIRYEDSPLGGAGFIIELPVKT